MAASSRPPEAAGAGEGAEDAGSIVLSFPVPRELAGLRLDRFIQSRIPRLSRTRAQEIVRACAERKDGSRRRPSERVREGETVLLVRPRFEEPEVPRDFDVRYEDADVFALSKPAGLPMHPTATYHRNTLTFVLRERYGERAPSIAHRLDRETSGLVVCGRHFEATRSLKMAFEQRRVEKSYLAIVQGVVPRDRGTIELPLASVKSDGLGALHVMMEVSAAGARAVTRFAVVMRASAHTLVALWPETGRQHQLRVHLTALGFPIVGDKLYGSEGPDAFLDYIEHGDQGAVVRRTGHHRQALHAHTLTVPHPKTGAPLSLVAPLATDMRELFLALGGVLPGDLHERIAVLGDTP